MGYNRTAPMLAIDLNENLVRQAQRHTPDLSGTIETLLADFIARERAKTERNQAEIDEVIDAFNELHAEHGLLSDEFPTI